MKYPLAWYITWTTYGTWLRGDQRGSHYRSQYLAPDPAREESARERMTDDEVCLTDHQRAIVDAALVAECAAQGWILHERNVRTNHVHVVVSANKDGQLVRNRLKAVTAAVLSDDAGLTMVADKNGRRRWWTEKGNVVPVEDERSLEGICQYVRDQ